LFGPRYIGDDFFLGPNLVKNKEKRDEIIIYICIENI
jgi:hypothetical protein